MNGCENECDFCWQIKQQRQYNKHVQKKIVYPKEEEAEKKREKKNDSNEVIRASLFHLPVEFPCEMNSTMETIQFDIIYVCNAGNFQEIAVFNCCKCGQS